MPPPPPPSKSYLLRFDDTDSEEEDEGLSKLMASKLKIQQQQQQQQQPKLLAHPIKDKFIVDPIREEHQITNKQKSFIYVDHSIQEEGKESMNHHPEDDDRNDDTATKILFNIRSTNNNNNEDKEGAVVKLTKEKKKRKRKRNRRKKQAVDVDVEHETIDNNNKNKRNVSFSSVSIRFMERELGGDGVPADGGWPLGISDTIKHEVDSMTVNDYEDYRRLELETRWKKNSSTDALLPEVLETRPWDYRKQRDEKTGRSIRNPLFRPLDEDERHALLIDQPMESLTSNNNNNQNSHPKRSRSGSIDHPKRVRSGSIDHPPRMRSRSSSIDHCGIYDPVHVRHVRRELEDLRVFRSNEGNSGCTCRKLQVPQGKKKRLSVSKVKDELRKRRYKLPTQKITREELEQTLYKLVQEEPCCNDTNCTCIRNGIGCQADTCSCWSNVNPNCSSSSIRELCGNKLGMYIVDTKHIRSYREDVIAKIMPSSFVSLW